MQNKTLKICVYAICKNECKFVDKWLANMSEADYIVVLDTGSTDGTYEKLLSDSRVTRVERKTIDPWRFDVARNESMKLVPDDADILVCTDLDELFNVGWANVVRSAWSGALSQGVNRICYRYAWSHDASGKPTDLQLYDKIHSRDYHWVYPIHEGLYPIDPNFSQVVIDLQSQVLLEHFRDESKPRGYYLDLLQMACQEYPTDVRMRVLYARELQTYDIDRSIQEYNNTLMLIESSKSYSKEYLLEALSRLVVLYYNKQDLVKAITCSLNLMLQDNTLREPYLYLAEIYFTMQQFELAVATVKTGLKLSKQHFIWIENPLAYSSWPDFLLCRAYCGLGQRTKAIKHISNCLKYSPENQEFIKIREDLIHNK